MADPSALGGPHVITWLLVIIGWIIINWQHNRRETRKEQYSQLTEINTWLADIEHKAIAFHTAETYDQQTYRELVRDIARITPQIKLLGLLNDSKAIAVLVTDIRRAITLNNADASTFEPKASNDPLLDDISNSIDELRIKLQKAFVAKYHLNVT